MRTQPEPASELQLGRYLPAFKPIYGTVLEIDWKGRLEALLFAHRTFVIPYFMLSDFGKIQDFHSKGFFSSDNINGKSWYWKKKNRQKAPYIPQVIVEVLNIFTLRQGKDFKIFAFIDHGKKFLL